MVNRDADSGRELSRGDHRRDVLAFGNGNDVGRRPVFGHMLISGEDPGDPAKFDVVLVGQDTPRPDARGDRVAAVHANPRSFEVFRGTQAGQRVMDDGAMMEGPDQEDRQRRDALAERPGA